MVATEGEAGEAPGVLQGPSNAYGTAAGVFPNWLGIGEANH